MGINGAMFIQTEQTPNPQTLKIFAWEGSNEGRYSFFPEYGRVYRFTFGKKTLYLRWC